MSSLNAHYIEHQNISGTLSETNLSFVVIPTYTQSLLTLQEKLSTLTFNHYLYGRNFCSATYYRYVSRLSFEDQKLTFLTSKNQLVTLDIGPSTLPQLSEYGKVNPSYVITVDSPRAHSIFSEPDLTHLRFPFTTNTQYPIKDKWSYDIQDLINYSSSGLLPKNFIVVNIHSLGTDVVSITYPFSSNLIDYGPDPSFFTDTIRSFLINPYYLLKHVLSQSSQSIISNLDFKMFDTTYPNQISDIIPAQKPSFPVDSTSITGFTSSIKYSVSYEDWTSISMKLIAGNTSYYFIHYDENTFLSSTTQDTVRKSPPNNYKLTPKDLILVELSFISSGTVSKIDISITITPNNVSYKPMNIQWTPNTANFPVSSCLAVFDKRPLTFWRPTLDTPLFVPQEFAFNYDLPNVSPYALRLAFQEYTTMVIDQTLHEAVPNLQPVNLVSDLNESILSVVKTILNHIPDEPRLLPSTITQNKLIDAISTLKNIESVINDVLNKDAIIQLIRDEINKIVVPELNRINDRLDRLPTISPNSKYIGIDSSYMFDYFNDVYPTPFHQYYLPFHLITGNSPRSLVSNNTLIYYSPSTWLDIKKHTIILDPQQDTLITHGDDSLFTNYPLDMSQYFASLYNVVYFTFRSIKFIYLKFDSIIPAELPYVVYSLDKSFDIV